MINSIKRYVQYRATLSTTNPTVSPELRTVTVNHAIGNPNTPPVAVDDSASTPEDTPYVFPASGTGSLTANDTDAETPSNQLTVIAVTTPAHGSAVLNLNGTFDAASFGTREPQCRYSCSASMELGERSGGARHSPAPGSPNGAGTKRTELILDQPA